jgi:hypothetical protein
VLLLAGLEELFAVASAQQEGEPAQVAAQLLDAVGAVADVFLQRCREVIWVAGEPAGEEVQELSEFGSMAGLAAKSKVRSDFSRGNPAALIRRSDICSQAAASARSGNWARTVGRWSIRHACSTAASAACSVSPWRGLAFMAWRFLPRAGGGGGAAGRTG